MFQVNCKPALLNLLIVFNSSQTLKCAPYVADNIGPQNGYKASSKGVGCGKKTIRLRSNGPATVEDVRH